MNYVLVLRANQISLAFHETSLQMYIVKQVCDLLQTPLLLRPTNLALLDPSYFCIYPIIFTILLISLMRDFS